jgi:predicted amino acid racemase
MSSLRIEIDLSKIRHNTRCLSERLKLRGIGITAVTKAVSGHPEIAQAMLDGGAVGLADSRVSNVERMRLAGIKSSITLIRTPILSQIDEVICSCDISYNTELEVLASLAETARSINSVHRVMLMVEMGDMREGIMPENIGSIAKKVIEMPGLALIGIGANFACLSDTAPNAKKMAALSTIARSLKNACGAELETVSGGNSANLPWAFGPHSKGRINNLRLGEAILLGVEPVSGKQISGLFTDAFTLIAEVIETKVKQAPTSVSFTDPALVALRLVPENIHAVRSIIALGKQDTDISGLTMPSGVTYLGATSDHMIVETTQSHPRVGSELNVQMNYSSLMRAMSAPDITKVILSESPPWKPNAKNRDGPLLAVV